jgi:chromosome partitioning protein
MGKIVTVCNQKGGVGKTTTTINLSAFLASAGKKTLIIDMDPQGNATSGMGIKKESIKASLYDLILEKESIGSVIKNIHLPNLFILPSNIDLTGLEVELVGAIAREYKLKEALREAKDNYDYIIIDTPPSLGLLTINALTACDMVLVPLQCEYYALEGLSKLLNTLDLVKNNLNPAIEIGGLILTMADFRTRLTSEVINEIKNHFPDKVYSCIIPRNIKLSEAPGYGKPVLLYDKESVGATKYKELADEFLKRQIVANVSKTESYDNLNQGEVNDEPDPRD